MSEPREKNRMLNHQQQLLLRRKLLERSASGPSEPERYRATSAQAHMWLNFKLNPRSAAYHNAAYARVRGPLDVGTLESTIQAIVRRHSPLRSIFRSADDGTLETLLTDQLPRLTQVDVSQVPAEAREVEIERISVEFARRPFELERLPGIRVLLVRAGAQDHVLTIAVHHIVSDGWSFRVLLSELATGYRARRAGMPDPWPPLVRTYADYAQTQRLYEHSKSCREDVEYWRAQLAGAPPMIDLPRDRPRPPVRSEDGARQRFTLEPSELEAVHRLSRAASVTPFSTAYAAFLALLYRRTSERDICVGTPILGRYDEEYEKLIGLFFNMVVLRASVDPQEPFSSVLRRAAQVVTAAFDHARPPFESVVTAINPPRSPGYLPFYQVVFSSNNAPIETARLDDLEITPIDLDLHSAPADLMVSLRLGANRGDGFVDYRPDLFEPGTIAATVAQWRQLLVSAAASPETPVGRLRILDRTERERIEVWSRAPEPKLERPPETLAGLILARAHASPDAVAVRTSAGIDHTYAELAAASARIAHRLGAAGVRAGDRVAIRAGRSFEQLAALLGVLRVGAAYVPLPRDLPVARVEVVVKHAGCAVELCDADLASDLPSICAITLKDALAYQGAGDPPGGAAPDGIACVLFTSGSTGTPKGVAMSNRAIARRVLWRQHRAPLGADDRVLCALSFAFDVSLWEIYGTLIAGASLVLIEEPVSRDPRRWVEHVIRNDITVILAVPSWLHLFVTACEQTIRSVRQIICCGELLEDVVVQHAQRVFPDAELYNSYGPTEAIIAQTFVLCDRPLPSGAISIGRPLDDARVYVLDDALKVVPAGVTGELFIGGDSLADGYWADPAATAERFVPDPYADRPGARMYRTGDLGRWAADGLLHFLGRRDWQVKLNGYRIELEEIEHALLAYPGIRQAAVVLGGSDADRRLLAYFDEAPERRVVEKDLRAHLERTLPAYMMPTSFIRLPFLPVNRSGKIDRPALVRMSSEPYAPVVGAPPVEALSPATGATIEGGALPASPVEGRSPDIDGGPRPAASPLADGVERRATARSVPDRSSMSEWFYETAWRRLSAPIPTVRPRGVVWLMAKDAPLGRRIAELLDRAGSRVVRIGSGDCTAISPDGRVQLDRRRGGEGLVELADQLRRRELLPDAILDLAAFEQQWPASGGLADKLEAADRAIDRAFHFTASVISSLTRHVVSRPLRIVLVSRGVHRLRDGEPCNPLGAAVLGAVRVLPRECGGLACVGVDLAEESTAADWTDRSAAQLVGEVMSTEDEPIVAYRDDQRWGRVHAHVQLGPQPEVHHLLRPRGTYLITGGMGGLGLAFADHLSRCYQANLVLIARPSASSIPERELQLFRERGSQVLVIEADVADPARMAAAVAAARQRFGAIHGAIHAAGVGGHALLPMRRRADSDAVLRPKVRGAIILGELLGGEGSADFVALFSSTAGALGGTGALDYSTANAFLDSFAMAHPGRPRMLSIAWDRFHDVGMAVRWSAPEGLAPAYGEWLAGGMSATEGVQAFTRALASGLRHVLVSVEDLAGPGASSFDLFARLGEGAAPAPTDAAAEQEIPTPPVAPASAPAEPAWELLEREVAEVWRELLRCDELHPTTNFFDVGGHSLLLLTLGNRLSKRFGRLIPLARLMDEPTVRGCARALREGG